MHCNRRATLQAESLLEHEEAQGRHAMDHRWGVRIAIDTPVLLVYPASGTGRGRMTEVSTSGGFVRTRFAPPDLVLIHIASEFEEIEGYIVRHSADGIAVEWPEPLPPPIHALLAPVQ